MKKEKVQIKLGEIPEEGRAYSYSNASGEMNLGLKDLINENSYTIDIEVKPVGSVYEVRGKIETSLPRICSQCGWELNIPVKKTVNELLVTKSESEKGDSQSRTGSLNAEGDSVAVTYITGGVLDAEALVHELVALEDPAYPSCEKENCENLEAVKQKMRELEVESSRALGIQEGANPFSALKSLKF